MSARIVLLVVLWLFAACQPSTQPPMQAATQPPMRVAPGQSWIAYVPSEGLGEIAVRVRLPDAPRYAQGAGVVVEVATFLTGDGDFYNSLDVTRIGLVQVSYLWPGLRSRSTDAQSGGVYDEGGENCTRALRDVIRYAAGEIPDRDGVFLAERSAIPVRPGGVGLYAFSHPGLMAVRVLASYGAQLPVAYFVGRENPTNDVLTAVEIGHFDDQNHPLLNPRYHYPEGYSAARLLVDYAGLGWDAAFAEKGFEGRPYFDLNGNHQLDASDYALGSRVPQMAEKRIYSAALTQALLDQRVLTADTWPADMLTAEQAARAWAYWDSPSLYPLLKQQTPNLKVMLIFARSDHVQPATDKPHVHQAYDGFQKTAGLWTRLGPDTAYLRVFNSSLANQSSEHPANTQPEDWRVIESWGHSNDRAALTIVPLAGVAEMSDRWYANDWQPDLEQTLLP